jgi:hypothetical protein
LISSLSPASATAGSHDLPLTIAGSGFTSGFPVVVWSFQGSQNSLTQGSGGSDTEINVVIPATLLTQAGTAEISVQMYQHPADSFPTSVSNSVPFNVTAP